MESTLQHHGVKGQKWGVINKSKTSSGKKRIRDMSDVELRTAIARKRMEKDLRDLNSDTRSNGKKFITDVLTQIGKNTLINLGTQTANHFVGQGINALFKTGSDDSAKRVVNPQKGQSDKK